ncbi:unnamed protein product [Vitrella brassicaformis CCMP3155]|uniref:Uncharacterized protein n=1 Tax=Vitrella brassicaformis (strain CCMP3155) TaxID=1169540 RepID=A0A0G4E8Z1_VITBC|nr:unnamed protein product [Vitrella brassicaformis CCMP3155]|eukprot:CEL91988.1 unnamed protein product [Vitrella brassicaformis CCMP3155]
MKTLVLLVSLFATSCWCADDSSDSLAERNNEMLASLRNMRALEKKAEAGKERLANSRQQLQALSHSSGMHEERFEQLHSSIKDTLREYSSAMAERSARLSQLLHHHDSHSNHQPPSAADGGVYRETYGYREDLTAA